MIDAASELQAEQIVAVMPYFGMARQDRKDKPSSNRCKISCQHAFGSWCDKSNDL